MPAISLFFGIDLILLGLIAYFGAMWEWWGSGKASVTALIPAFFGIAILVCGLLGLKESFRKHAMHVAAAIALLGAIPTARGVLGVFTMIGGGEVERPAAVVVQAIMFLFCVVFLLLAINSFIQARRARSMTEPNEPPPATEP